MVEDIAQPIIAGADYVRQITALRSDRLAREEFLKLALTIAPPGGAVFDFGSGPGIDARRYAEHGLRVVAYDIDTNMCDYFTQHCGDLIALGNVKLERGTYGDFLARHIRRDDGSINLITSNFAPLNLIGNLNELFAAFHSMLAPGGKLLVSVLNPYFIGDMRYAWWWWNLRHLWRHGHYSIAGAQASIVRRGLGDFSKESAPYFRLDRVFRGMPANRAPNSFGVDVSRSIRSAWMRITDCRFMFLMFTRL